MQAAIVMRKREALQTATPDFRTKHCADFAAERAGIDVWSRIGPSPRSWREAANLYQRLGVRTLEQAVTAVLGPPISPLKACRGDVVMAQDSLGICRGEVAEFMGAVLPMRLIDKAWSIEPPHG